MSKFGRELLIGTVPVALVFLLYIGVNIVPVLLLAIIAGGVYLLVTGRGGFGNLGIAGGGKEKRLRQQEPSYTTFEDIGGQETAKRELMEALDFLIRADEIRKMGIRPLRGILLTGPPGTGKTLLAKAAAHYTNSVFLSAAGSEFVEMYVGVGASRIRELFREARQRAQKEKKESAIIFIDEIEVIGARRDGGQQREYDQTLNQLLTEMDGIQTTDSPRILLMAATNRKEMLDPALTRPGRFDRHIMVDLPDRKGRLHILNIHAKNKPVDESVSLEQVAEETFGFSGAQLESVMNEAAIYALRENCRRIEQKHLSMAIDKVMMGEKTNREATREERQRVALHELGHAIVAERVHPGSVSQVALSPRGQALGYVRHNPQQDQYLYTRPYLEGQIMIALGGSVAEEMFFEGRSTGSRNDFEQAIQLVKTMIDCGLTELGIVNEQMLSQEDWMRENRRILDELTERTRQLLEMHRDVFGQALDILLREESLSGDEFRALLDRVHPASQEVDPLISDPDQFVLSLDAHSKEEDEKQATA
jgi:ATP-dependent metalloprotease FtsH